MVEDEWHKVGLTQSIAVDMLPFDRVIRCLYGCR